MMQALDDLIKRIEGGEVLTKDQLLTELYDIQSHVFEAHMGEDL